MDIYLHIGSHRTATTTFQSYLTRNSTVLTAAGLSVWGPKRLRDGFFSGLLKRPQDITPDDQRRAHRSLGRIGVELTLAERQGLRAVLLSEENIMGSVRNNLRQQVLYPDLDFRLDRLRPAFQGRVRRVGIGIRSYDSYWASALAFAVARGHRCPTEEVLDRLVTQPRRWRHVIEEVAAVLGGAEIIVWPFEAIAGRPERQLASLAGPQMPLPTAGARDWCNASPRVDDLRRLAATQGQAPELLPRGEGRWQPFDEAQQLAMRAQYAQDLAWLRDGADGLATLVEDRMKHLRFGDTREHAAPGQMRRGHGHDRQERGVV